MFTPGNGPNRAKVDAYRLGIDEPPPLNYSNTENFLESFILRYEHAPIHFVEEILSADLDEWSKDVLCDVAAGERLISIRSGHGVGKTYTLAVLSIWFLSVKFRCKIVATAPTQGQLFDSYLSEVKSMFKRLPTAVTGIFEAKSDRIEHKAYPEDCFLTAVTSSRERPEALQGRHSDHVLLICDEASGIPDDVFKAAGGSMNGPNRHMVLASNPTRLLGRFARSQLKAGFREQFRRYHVGKHNSTRIEPSFEQEILNEHGADSDEYRIRVLGEFAKRDSESYIGADLLTDAMARDVAPDKRARWVWAIDPARFGQDGTAFGKRHGPLVYKAKVEYGKDTMEVAGWIKNEWDNCLLDERPATIMVDAIGIGAGVADRLLELNLPVRAINVSESPTAPLVKAVKLRDELFLKTKQILQERRIWIEEDEDLITDITMFKHDYTGDGRLKIESKKEVKKRLKRSPDRGDVLCMLLGGVDAAVIYGSGDMGGFGSGPRGEAIRRNTGVVSARRRA